MTAFVRKTGDRRLSLELVPKLECHNSVHLLFFICKFYVYFLSWFKIVYSAQVDFIDANYIID